MANSPLGALLSYLRQFARDSAATDGQLLEQFASRQDKEAFDVLIQRHGSLVWSVCRRILREEHDAEDAFQATFLVLVRKARAVSKRESVRSWLYSVALRTALRAKARQTRRRTQERQAPPMQAGDSLATVVWDDLRPLLDEEVNRLPEKYRAPVTLCYLQGLTHEQAARQLGCSRDTVATRLTRARQRLHQRLTRRGLALSLGTLGMLLTQNATSAVVPMRLVKATVQAAALVVAGKAVTAGALSVPVVALAEGVLRAMFLTQVKMVGAVLLTAAVVATGAGVAVYRGQAEQPAAKRTEPRPDEKSPKEAQGRDAEAKEPQAREAQAKEAQAKEAQAKEAQSKGKLKPLLHERLEWAQKEYKYMKTLLLADRITPDSFDSVALRLLRAEVEFSEKKADRIAAYEAYLKHMVESAQYSKAAYEADRITEADYAKSQYNLVEAKIWLEREKAGATARTR